MEGVREMEGEAADLARELERIRGECEGAWEANMAAAEKDEESFAAAIACEWGEMRDAFDAQVSEREAALRTALSSHAHEARAARDAVVEEVTMLRAKLEGLSRAVPNTPRVGFEAGFAVPATPRARPQSARPGTAGGGSRPGSAWGRPESRLR
uniref:Uncharacterized protein n=1 Tax=Hemiselmis andersenii TaxID=464988 RepID=A0A7S1HNS4_HEMAN|mmetsp:Transcript_8832/g.21631  ORF Transcript_8832/g.21631 Transcript_8832/m.21631 type:complete len:154 (+) Transcript_8832:206-667(+)